jgi:hypothetical protein
MNLSARFLVLSGALLLCAGGLLHAEPHPNESLIKTREGKWYLVDERGKSVTPAVYDSLIPLNSDCFRTEVGGRYGVVDFQGTTVLPPDYDGIAPQGGRHFMVTRGTKIGLATREGRFIGAPVFDRFCFLDATRETAIFTVQDEGDEAPRLMLAFQDGGSLPFADHWESDAAGGTLLPNLQARVFSDRAGLCAAPSPDAAPFETLAPGAAVAVLAQGDRFYRDGAELLAASFIPDPGYLAAHGLKPALLDRWLKVRSVASKKEGYIRESLLTGEGWDEDLDGDGKTDLVLVKGFAYCSYLDQGDVRLYTHDRVLACVRVIDKNAIAFELKTADGIPRDAAGAPAADYLFSGLEAVKVPAGRSRYFFLKVKWAYSLEDGYAGSAYRPLYLFSRDRFVLACAEKEGHRGGGGGESAIAISWDVKRRALVMKETHWMFDHGYEQETERRYVWNAKKLQFIFEKERVLRKTQPSL